MALLLNTGNTVSRSYTIIKPSPTHPIQPSETGDRTGNLFELTDSSATANAIKTLVDFGEDVTFDTITCSCAFENLEAEFYYGAFLDYLMDDGTHQYVALSAMRNVNDDSGITTNVKVNGNYYNTKQNITFRKIQAYLYTTGYNKFKSGSIKWAFYDSEKKDYEPYGYKIPISSGGVTTNIYLGSTQTVRQIKKLVFTGQENWTYRSGQPSNVFFTDLSGTNYINNNMLCTHYLNQDRGSYDDMEDKHILLRVNGDLSGAKIAIRDTNFTDGAGAGGREKLKAWLAQQYANGTPVTVWCVIATPETAAVNEPLMKIGDYADEVSGITIPTITGADSFDVLTTLKPSEVSLTYHGWHDTTAKEWDGSEWQ